MERELLALSYDYYIKKWNSLILKANGSDNKALFLFDNGARTTLFMLESLFRVNRKKDETLRAEFWYKEFKLIEDALGQIDYYNFFEIELTKQKSKEKEIINYFKKKKTQTLVQLNKDLKNSLWFKNYKQHSSLLLKDVATITNKQSTFDVAKTISKEIDKISDFVKNEIQYNDIELSTHEIRRKLRWISIYSNSFRGLFQLRHHAKSRIKLQKYLTEEIITSPFNSFPKNETEESSVYYKDNYFFALSWIINELGNLKDRGLFVTAITEAIENTENTNSKTAHKKACELLKEEENCLTEILHQTKVIVTDFYKNEVMEKLNKDLKQFYKS